jgi:phosphatidylethanolamine-binding protein (PEBP) family uncharacterized protein
LLLGAAAVSGCGGSTASRTVARHEVPTPPSSGQQQALKAQIALGSAAVRNEQVAAHYTCKGANESMPFAWAGVSPQSKELVLEVKSFGSTVTHLTYNWLVAGISPKLQRIEAGKLPPGAIVGRNSDGKVGYSLCPAAGSPRTIVSINLLAYPKKLSFKPGWEEHDLSRQVETCNCVEWGSILGFIS